MKTATSGYPSVETYAAYLVELVRSDLNDQSIMREAMACGDLTCWEDLNEYVDANEYIIDADDQFDIVIDRDDDLAFDDLMQFHWDAIDIAEAELFGSTGKK